MTTDFVVSRYARSEAVFARTRSGWEELERSPPPLTGWGRKLVPYFLAAVTVAMIWRLI